MLPSGPAQAQTSRPQVSSGPSGPPPQGPRAASQSASPNQDAFLRQYATDAIDVSRKTGIPYQLLLAIPANETGWGASVVGNNLFGIKGQGQVSSTWEVINGQRVNTQSSFKTYGSGAESMQDFATLISTEPRYRNVWSYLQQNPSDWRGAAQMLLDDGYATDPDWAKKVISLGNQVDTGPEASSISPSTGIKSVIDTGAQAIGMRYQWGGSGGRGQSALAANTDCSGFVAWAYEASTGIRLTPQTSGMYAQTTSISPQDAMPGDLIFFNHGQGAENEHVAIYAGNGQMLHDSSLNPDGGVDITPIWSGAEFRRVPGVDPSLINKGASATTPDQDFQATQWVIQASNGQQMWIGADAQGHMRSQSLGPLPSGTTASDGTVLDASWNYDSQQGGGNEGMGAGLSAGEDSLPPDKDDWMYPYQGPEPTHLKPSYPVAGARQYDTPDALTPKLDGGDVYPWTKNVHPRPQRIDPQTSEAAGPQSPDTTYSQDNSVVNVYDDSQPFYPDSYFQPNFVPDDPPSKIPIGSGNMGAGDDWYSDQDINTQADDAPVGGTYYAGTTDDQGNVTPLPPPSATTVNRAADLGWLGPAVAPTASGKRAAAQQASDDYTVAQADIQDESQQLSKQQTGIANRQRPSSTPSYNGATLPPRPDMSHANDLVTGQNKPRNLVPDPYAPQTGPGTPVQALPLDLQDQVRASRANLTDQNNPTTPATSIAAAPTPPSDPRSDLARQSNFPLLGPAGERQSATQPTDDNAPQIPSVGPLIDISPTNQAKLMTAAEIAYAIHDPAVLQPGVNDAIRNVMLNGADPQPALNKLMLLDDSTPALKRAASGNQLSPLDAIQAGSEWQQKMQDYRADLIRAVQAPEQRGTPEGELMANGIAMATDPLNYIGMDVLAPGRKLITEGGEFIAPKVERTIEQAVAPELVDTAHSLVRPLSQADSRATLQHASLMLQGPEATRLEDSARALAQTGHYDGLSGEQLRRTVLNSVARANPDATPREVVQMTDAILDHSAPQLTTDRLSKLYSSVAPGVEAARSRWYSTPLAQAAHAVELGQQARAPARMSAAYALRAGVGAATGAGATALVTDPQDPDRTTKILAGGAAGAVLAPLASMGLGWAVDHTVRPVTGKTIDSMARIFAPVERLSPDVRSALQTWAGTYTAGVQGGLRLSDEMRGAFGKQANLALAQFYETHGYLEPKWIRNANAQEFIRKWKSLTSWATKYDIVPDPLHFSANTAAKAYVPHVQDAEMSQAIQFGQDELSLGRKGRMAVNPFDYYNEPRHYPTLNAGVKNGVKYSEDVPRDWGNYFSTAVRRAANKQLTERLVQIGEKNNPIQWGPSLTHVMLKGEDVVRVPDTWTGRLSRAVPAERFFPELKGQNIKISDDLAKVFTNMFEDQGLGTGASSVLDVNGFFKHNILGGSAFHMINEVRQLYATQGWNAPGNMFRMAHQMSTPGGARKFWANEGPEVSKAIVDGLNLNMTADRPAMSERNRFATILMNSVLGGFSGYQVGDTEDERRANALKGAGLGAAMAAPFMRVGGHQQSLIETFSNLMWGRYIPFMKYTTYQMYKPQYGGRAAAEFSNEVFGGQNLMAIGRSRTTQDIMKFLMLAPDWQEGWARQIGNAAFSWGGNAPLGDMNRSYWKNAAFQSVALLEGMNLAFGGHLSTDNAPDAQLMVDATRFYDMTGMKHVDQNGNSYTPYWDVLGPYRSMFQPLLETARAGAAAAYNMMGIKPGEGAFDKQIRGEFGAVPEADPATQWKNFLSSRIGFFPAMGIEGYQAIVQGKDWAGRPIDQADDDFSQRAANRMAQIFAHVLPTGQQQILSSAQRGDPWQVAAFSAATGARVKHESANTAYFQFQDQYVKDLGIDPEEWQRRVSAARDHNNDIDQQVELIQSGLQNNNGSPAKPGESDMTAVDRDRAIQKLTDGYQSQRAMLQDLIPQGLDQGTKDRYQSQFNWLAHQSVVGGTNAPADVVGRPDLDDDELYRLAWNRDPDEIARIQGTQPPATDMLGSATQFMQQHLLASPVGKDQTQQLAALRARWTAETGEQWNLDPAVMQDLVKARLYGLPNGQLPALPGVTSEQLDAITKEYQAQGTRETGGAAATPSYAASAKQQWLFEQAAQLGVDPTALATRIRLRTLPMSDQTPAMQTRANALDLQYSNKAVPFQNKDGTPYGDPKQWKDLDTKLAAYKDRAHYSNGLYYSSPGVQWDELNQANQAKQTAQADRYKAILTSPNKNDWYRTFGDGANLTDADWAKFQAGTLDMWTDHPDPAEAQNRIKALRTAQAFTTYDLRTDPLLTLHGNGPGGKWAVYGKVMNPKGQMTQQGMTLAGYVAYIKGHTTKEFLDKTGFGGDVQVDPNSGPGVP